MIGDVVLRCEGLTRSYGEGENQVHALIDAALEVRSGELLDAEAHRELADRILRRDAAGAQRLARDLLGRSVPGESAAEPARQGADQI